ncbi:HNH endonuclease signature motif containing protein [Mucilaginibacter sp. UC70_90]
MLHRKPADDFSKEVDCIYKEERYTVRDNGEVLRHARSGRRPRPTDNQWTFGKPNNDSGYMEIASVPVHRIVATAFLGIAPTPKHVVDHIDTNKRNNRPENLRWVTRLENVLLNPITTRRIEIACGSVEAFLADPSKFRDKFREPNYEWMCAVSTEEAQTSLKRLLIWAQDDRLPSGGSLGAWIFNRNTWQDRDVEANPEHPEIIMAKTLNAAQRNWQTASEFPCCPARVRRGAHHRLCRKIKNRFGILPQ